jgi:hypothetical protein
VTGTSPCPRCGHARAEGPVLACVTCGLVERPFLDALRDVGRTSSANVDAMMRAAPLGRRSA